MENINDRNVILYMRNSVTEKVAHIYAQSSLVWIRIDDCAILFVSAYDVMRIYDNYGVDVACEYIVHCMNEKKAYVSIDHANLCKIADTVLLISQKIIYKQGNTENV